MVTVRDTIFGGKTHRLASVRREYWAWRIRIPCVIVTSESAVRHREIRSNCGGLIYSIGIGKYAAL